MSEKKALIMHLVVGLEVGGTETMLLKSLPELNKKYRNIVVSITETGPIGKQLIKQGIRVVPLHVKPGVYFSAIGRFRKVALQYSPDLLITYLIYPDLFGRIFGRLFGIKKIICFERGALLHAEPLRYIDYLTKFLVSLYLANSQTLKSRLLKKLHISKQRMEVIPNFVDPAKFYIEKDHKLKTKLGFGASDKLLTFVGNLRVKKGHNTLVKAFKKVSLKFPDTHLLLVGQGDQLPNLSQLSAKLALHDKVHFLGNRIDIPEILSITDVFIFPSEEEGMSNALLEALAAQKVIVCSNIDENAEVVGDAAITFKVNDSNDLCKKVCKALTLTKNKREDLIKKTKDRVVYFSLKNHFYLLDKAIQFVLS